MPDISRGASLGSSAIVPARQVVLYAADLGLDQVEVVEEPLGGRGEELAAMDVIGQDAVGVAQNPRVLVHPGEELLAAVIAGSREREAGGEPPRALLQTLDAQELGAEGAFSAAALPGTEEATQGAGHELPSPRCTNNSRRGIEYAHFTQVIHRRSHDAPMRPQCRYSERRTPTPSSRVQTFAGSNAASALQVSRRRTGSRPRQGSR